MTVSIQLMSPASGDIPNGTDKEAWHTSLLFPFN